MTANQTHMPASQPEIPKGFVQDREGRLVPKDRVKPVDKARDDLVKRIAKQARKISGELSKVKGEVFEDVEAFVERSAAEYGKSIGGKKGNMTLYSYDGSLKLQIANGETKVFDERLQVAKSIIDECIHEWAKGSNKNIQALVEHAFQVDKTGKVSVERVLSLRRIDIEDERWEEAMKAIADSIQIAGSKRYFRIYERVGETDEYRPIALDAASA